MEEHLENLRRAELQTVKSWFKPNIQVLELGGGSGYQASLIASWGCEVVSIDLPNRSTPSTQYYSVQDYDGANIPFNNESFDIIFSSNVLEHIQNLPPIFTEMHRVLKPDGIAIHVLPNPAWRFWTSLSHYGYLLKYLLGKQNSISGAKDTPILAKTLHKYGAVQTINRVLFAGPHGEYPNAFSEMYFFSRRRWLNLFKINGFDIDQVMDNRIFYTGYGLFPSTPLKIRCFMAPFLGSACSIYIMHSNKKN
jgi:ubiquinone/menaquinone biosynthesis C-methylase UbiE